MVVLEDALLCFPLRFQSDCRHWTLLPFWIALKLQAQETDQSYHVLLVVTFVGD